MIPLYSLFRTKARVAHGLLWLLLFVGLGSCQPSTVANTGNTPDYKALTQQYFRVYAVRKDFDSLMSFYAPKAQLADYNLGIFCPDKDSLAAFYDWNNGTFEMLTSRNLTLQHVVADGPKTAVKGYFHPFIYNGKRWDNYFHFTIWLHWNEAGKITKQEDWIIYPMQFLKARASNPNLWIVSPDDAPPP